MTPVEFLAVMALAMVLGTTVAGGDSEQEVWYCFMCSGSHSTTNKYVGDPNGPDGSTEED